MYTYFAHGHLHLASCSKEAVIFLACHVDSQVGPHQPQHSEVDTQGTEQVRVAVEDITVTDGPAAAETISTEYSAWNRKSQLH